MNTKRKAMPLFGLSLLAAMLASGAVAVAQTATTPPAPPPLSAQRLEYLREHDPATLNQLLNRPSPQIPQGGQQQPAGGEGSNDPKRKQQ